MQLLQMELALGKKLYSRLVKLYSRLVNGVRLKNQVRYEVVRLISMQGCGRLGSVRQGRCEQHLKNAPSWVKQAGKDPQSHTHRAGK